MKRDIKEFDEKAGVKLANLGSKRTKVMVDGQSVEKATPKKSTTPMKTLAKVSEEKKTEAVVIPPELKPVTKKTKKTVAKEEPEMEQVKPKKPTSNYIFFSNPNNEMLRKEKGYSVVEAMKASGVAWNELTDAEKQKFNDMAAKDKQRFLDQTEEVKEKGFFIMEDGSKSSEHMVKVKKEKVVAVKTKEMGTQTNKITLAEDLDYIGALKLARSLKPNTDSSFVLGKTEKNEGSQQRAASLTKKDASVPKSKKNPDEKPVVKADNPMKEEKLKTPRQKKEDQKPMTADNPTNPADLPKTLA